MAIVIVNGISGSGKSTVQEFISNSYGFPVIHPIEPLYRMLWETMGKGLVKPKKMLSQEFKQVIVNPNDPVPMTVHNYLIAQYHFHVENNVCITAPFIETKGLELLKTYGGFSIGSIRNPAELIALDAVIRWAAVNMPSVQVTLINLGGRGIVKSSDTQHQELTDSLRGISGDGNTFSLINSGTIAQLHESVESVLDDRV